eukprot:Plantae.Rhodophyta-Purpureofilum_apyrenoidigerum.ctg3305.p1 GENE.Plantae.Rhodophyta-Purpureofilum_apyrenoidigerum.ctg3305~~Plantae.Rhodophyta-Purpureofilum_apyrenoidigerum.ctg3305.p1  ORF type:complete len:631 (+),score=82.90 Plantae.Rhodophyta-Purpureofilum_apyrenoidigerum.ctg3305:252-2144(+)
MSAGGYMDGPPGNHYGYGAPPPGAKPAVGRPNAEECHGSKDNYGPLDGAMPLREEGSDIELKISCRDLMGNNGGIPSATALIYMKTFGVDRDFGPIGQTEIHSPSSSPQFSVGIPATHRFHRYQEVRIAIFDVPHGGHVTANHLIGAADVLFGQIIGANPNSPLKMDLKHTRSQSPTGSIIIGVGTNIDPGRRMVTLKLGFEEPTSAADIAKSGRRDPSKIRIDSLKNEAFTRRLRNRRRLINPRAAKQNQQAVDAHDVRLVVLAAPDFDSQSVSTGEGTNAMTNIENFDNVYTSPALIMNDEQTPQVKSGWFPPMVVSAKQLNRGHDNRTLYLSVYRDDTPIGGVMTTLRHLQMFQPGQSLSMDPTGSLIIHSVSTRQESSFADIVCKGEIDLQMMFALDFTASNGNPREPGTLHSQASHMPSQYEALMRTFANIILPICSSNIVPAFGFGAKLPPQGGISHCFPLSGNMGSYEFRGVEDLAAAYKRTCMSVEFYGPTVFSEVLYTARTMNKRRASQIRNKCPYMLLVIFTDGNISDGDTFMDTIVNAAAVEPISVIIVGLGHENYAKTWQCLGDNEDLPRHYIKEAVRRNVHFVTLDDSRNNLSELATMALYKIPDQVLDYLRIRSGL